MNIQNRAPFIIAWGIITTVVSIIFILLGWMQGSVLFIPFIAIIEIVIAIWLSAHKIWITVLLIIIMIIANILKAYLGANIIVLLAMMAWELLLIMVCRKSAKMG